MKTTKYAPKIYNQKKENLADRIQFMSFSTIIFSYFIFTYIFIVCTINKN